MSSELLQGSLEQDNVNPPLKLSIPHVLVATIVPFLFGYHLGFVLEPPFCYSIHTFSYIPFISN